MDLKKECKQVRDETQEEYPTTKDGRIENQEDYPTSIAYIISTIECVVQQMYSSLIALLF